MVFYNLHVYKTNKKRDGIRKRLNFMADQRFAKNPS